MSTPPSSLSPAGTPFYTVLKQIEEGTNTIRIVINSGGGAGNQKAPFTLMQKLRMLGFTGKFDICYHESPFYGEKCIQNIQLFAPGFNPANHAEQNFIDPTLGELYFRRLPYAEVAHDLPFVELAFTAAEHGCGDYQAFSAPKALMYHAANYVKLNPSGWIDDTISHKTVECFTLDRTIPITADARLRVPPAIQFQKDLIKAPRLARLLESILTAQRHNEIKFEFVYGLFQGASGSWLNPTEEVYRIATATLNAKLDTPVVMVIPYNSTLFSNRSKFGSFIEFYDEHSFNDLAIKLQSGTLSKDTIHVVCTGGLPAACFEALATESFFTVDEGCNLEELMEATQHPHVHGGRKLTELLHIPKTASAESLRLDQLQTEANDYLETTFSTQSDALVRWIQLLAQKDAHFMTYLADRYQAYLAKPDMVEEALSLIAEANPDCSEKRFIQQLLLKMNQITAEKRCSCLHDHEMVPLSRLKKLMQQARYQGQWQQAYYDAIKRLLIQVGENILTGSAGLLDAKQQFIAFLLGVPTSTMARPANKQTDFAEKTSQILEQYVDDVTVRASISQEVMAAFAQGLATGSMKTSAQVDVAAVCTPYTVRWDASAAQPSMHAPSAHPTRAHGKTMAYFL